MKQLTLKEFGEVEIKLSAAMAIIAGWLFGASLAFGVGFVLGRLVG